MQKVIRSFFAKSDSESFGLKLIGQMEVGISIGSNFLFECQMSNIECRMTNVEC
jgi:hypothetical protein